MYRLQVISSLSLLELASSFTTLFAVDPRKPNTTLVKFRPFEPFFLHYWFTLWLLQKGSLMVMKSSDVPVQHGVTVCIFSLIEFRCCYCQVKNSMLTLKRKLNRIRSILKWDYFCRNPSKCLFQSHWRYGYCSECAVASYGSYRTYPMEDL